MSSSINLSAFDKSTVLVTGASGFIGSHLVKNLKKLGAIVIELKRNETFYPELHSPVEYIFHLAGQKSSSIARDYPVETLKESSETAVKILEIARHSPAIKKVVLISSMAVYHANQIKVHHAVKESDAIAADSVYSASKISTEFFALSYFNDFKVPVSIARFANVFGSGQSTLAVIPALIEQMKKELEIFVGNTDTVRDFIFVDDAVDALLSIALSDRTSGHVYNVGTGQGTSVQDLIEIITRQMQYKGKITVDPKRLRVDEKPYLVADITSIKHATGWAPKTNLETGIQKGLLQ